ncbi:MAG TPA: hypothetical protein VJH20_01165 [Candidatus Nanoarchaeia archaeon]|nr:hypothetical protein [Candidatus Nanoarchaeia archaeon]
MTSENFKRFQGEMVEVTYKDGRRMLCYVDWVDDNYFTYKTQTRGRDALDHFSGFHVDLPQVRFDEVESIDKLVVEE